MLKYIVSFVVLTFLMLSCAENKPILSEGIWLAELKVMDDQRLPFNFKLTKEAGDYKAEIYNATEVIKITEITIINDSITMFLPVFEAYLKGIFTVNTISGVFHNESLDRTLNFSAKFGETNRFSGDQNPTQMISGVWETRFSRDSPEEYSGKGIFVQNDHKVSGTFRTTTGDYRFLEGIVTGDSLKLSAFDGSHAYLFLAKIKDSILEGSFYSGNDYKEPFTAKRNEVFELPNEDALTFMKEGYENFDFSFPDETGKMVSLSDPQFQGKPAIIQIMGTWCPNCLDETKFLVDFLKQYNDMEISVIGIAFEHAKTKEKAFNSIQKLKNRIGVPYPILLAQYGSIDKQEAQQKLPMLNHVLSYPTTIFIDKKAKVRKIKTGFNGPATGDKYLNFKKEFKEFVTTLVNE
ncbi:MAG: TlpA family protein disulfide reductase [Cellulophaga sp.]|nr:TlpA family protein disulfide reductase [Cellulophaga sp.]